MTRFVCRGIALLATLVCAVALLSTSSPESSTGPAVEPVADVAQFDPGNIISDAVFFDGSAMSAQQVDAFIDLKGAGCRAGSDGTPCLKDYIQDTTTRPSDAYCSSYTGAARESAATIIAKVAAACRVNPQVLLVIMQKEQSLVTNTGSSLYATRYQKAMGFACPDTAACDSAYFGFQNQVYSSARQFQRYATMPGSFGYRAGRTSNVLFNPNSACGSSPVLIQNQATAGLYVYTPYQPNRAALAAGYGPGDSCSAYGNRNFWLYFTDWFGSTQVAQPSALLPIGSFEAAAPLTGNQVRLVGWAHDPDTADPIAVHAYVDGRFGGVWTADAPRPDVQSAVAGAGGRHGFDVTLGVTPGPHEVCLFAINTGIPAANPSLGCRSVTTAGLPFGNLEGATVLNDRGLITGWAIDPDTTGPIAVHAYVNGAPAVSAIANIRRADVAAAYPAAGNAHGFSIEVPLTAGANEVCVFAINTPAPATNPGLGCQLLNLDVTPVGNFEAISGGATSMRVKGWALDPESRQPIDVHVYVDGANLGTIRADEARLDVATSRAGAGPAHGFDDEITVPAGKHTVCLFAINTGQGGVNPLLGCRPVDVGVRPIGRIEAAVASGYTARVGGWALDPDTPASIAVHLYVDGVFAQVVTAAGERPDVARSFPGLGSAHGFDTTLALAVGRHTVCAFGINVLGATGNPLLSCTDVTVGNGESLPIGVLEGSAIVNGITMVSGWSFDPDVPARSLETHYYVDGQYSGRTVADESRPDVGAAFPGVGSAHGYSGYFVLAPGRHTICTFAINQGRGAVNPALGCIVVTVP